MKKIVIMLVMLITVSKLSAQLTPILPYNNNSGHSLVEIRALAFGTSAKSIAFKDTLVGELKSLLKDTLEFSEENLPWALQDSLMFCEERVLKAGTYKNSGWNSKTGKIEFFSGQDFEGFVWVFRIGSYEKIICKCNCANLLIVKEQPKVVFVTPKVDTVKTQVQTSQQQITIVPEYTGHPFGQDGYNVVTVIPGGNNTYYGHPYGCDGYNVVNYVPGGYTQQNSLGGGYNTTTYTQGGVNNQNSLSTASNVYTTTQGGNSPAPHSLGGGTNVTTVTPGGH